MAKKLIANNISIAAIPIFSRNFICRNKKYITASSKSNSPG